MTDIPSYAVVFKVHFWDDFVERQLNRLRGRAGTEQLYVLVDETKASIPGINHDRVIRMTEQTAHDEGFLCYPQTEVFWYNTDYQLYHFVGLFPQFTYIVTVEYDCVINVDISDIVRSMAARDLGFVGERIRSPPSVWYWMKFTKPYYSDDLEISGRLLCLAAFSHDFAFQLKAARQNHTLRYLNQEIAPLESNEIPWPNNEGFVGAEIARLGIKNTTLSEFGDTSCYDWAPPHPEPQLPNLSSRAFIHPLLDIPRFLVSCTATVHLNIEDLFEKETFLGNIALQCDPYALLPGVLDYFVRKGNLPAIESLREHVRQRGADLHAIFNVARGKPAMQSSTWEHSLAATVSRDAGAVNGIVSGNYGFHIGHDVPPWWCVDLEMAYPVREIRIYNRRDMPNPSRSLVATSSTDMVSWTTLYEHQSGTPIGGADGKPLLITFPEPMPMRFLRLHLKVPEVLHLVEVEVLV